MAKRKQLTKEDILLFREQMRDVRRISHDKIVPDKPRRPPIAYQSQVDEERVIQDMMSDEYFTEEVETGEELLFVRTGIQYKLLRKLKRGQFQISAELDLHGLNVEAARSNLNHFLQECRNENRRCVRIIHGKGLGSKHRGPVLKNMVNKWLRQRKEVLAFCSAIPAHGGTGAVYVLLKR
jgi:DNA-nicking Smr family endonuclease